MQLLLSALALAVALSLPAVPAWPALSPFRLSQSDLAEIARVEKYLNGLRTLKARFRQESQQGERAAGTFYLSRPGKMRLEYDPPINDFIVSDGWFIFHWDAELKQQTHQPLSNNLANLILRENLKLSGDVAVSDVDRTRGMLELTLVEAEDPGNGRMTLVFADGPLRLQSWRVVDAQGLTTVVALDNVQTGVKLDDKLFYFRNPTAGSP